MKIEETSTSAFTEEELTYLLSERRLARLATVGKDGMPHIAPVGWSYNSEQDTIDIGGHNFERTKKYRDVKETGRAAAVVDDVLPPWKPRGVEVRGRAEVLQEPTPLIRIYPERIVSWGIHSKEMGRRNARTITRSVQVFVSELARPVVSTPAGLRLQRRLLLTDS